MPGDSGVTVVTNACAFYTTRGCGRIGRPAFPAPSVFRGGIRTHNSDAIRVARMRTCIWIFMWSIRKATAWWIPPPDQVRGHASLENALR